MQAMELAKMHEMRGEIYMADWFAEVKIDNKYVAQNDPCIDCPDRSLFPRAAIADSIPRHNPSIPAVLHDPPANRGMNWSMIRLPGTGGRV